MPCPSGAQTKNSQSEQKKGALKENFDILNAIFYMQIETNLITFINSMQT
jgi:hypothetical protein